MLYLQSIPHRKNTHTERIRAAGVFGEWKPEQKKIRMEGIRAAGVFGEWKPEQRKMRIRAE